MLYELPRFEHVDATTVAAAVHLLEENGEKAAVIAGATDLLGLLKDGIEGPGLRTPEILVNIKTIPQIDRISEYEAGLRIGAATTLARIADNDLVRRYCPVLSQAADSVGTTQLRNMGTLGGNICQRPRCMYFRHPHFLCFKKGGRKCFAVRGEHRDYHAILKTGKCVMAHPSDTAPALLALKAEAVIAGHDGERVLPLEELFTDADSCRETVLRPDQLIKEIRIPFPPPGNRQVFLKHRLRHAADFALASVAVVAAMGNGACRDIRLALGGVAPLPFLAEGCAEVVKGRTLDSGLLDDAAQAALHGAKPLRGNRFKMDLAGALVRRTLRRALAGDEEDQDECPC